MALTIMFGGEPRVKRPPGLGLRSMKLRLLRKLDPKSKPEAQAKERLATRSPSLALQAPMAPFPEKSAALQNLGVRLLADVRAFSGVPRAHQNGACLTDVGDRQDMTVGTQFALECRQVFLVEQHHQTA
jgi:hypothetical protein